MLFVFILFRFVLICSVSSHLVFFLSHFYFGFARVLVLVSVFVVVFAFVVAVAVEVWHSTFLYNYLFEQFSFCFTPLCVFKKYVFVVVFWVKLFLIFVRRARVIFLFLIFLVQVRHVGAVYSWFSI